MKKRKLFVVNVVLLVLLVLALASSLLNEFLHGAFFYFCNRTWTILHVIICLAMFAFLAWHLYLNCGKASSWWKRLRRQKPLSKWLFWISIFTLLSGLFAMIYFFVGHTTLGGVHGKIGFVALLLMIIHTAQRIKWYKN